MKSLILSLLIIALFIVVVGVSFLIAYGAYWLVLTAGAPKFVAVIVGIFVFLFLSIKVNGGSSN